MLLATNPFISAYIQSDFFGKAIFWSLFFLSAISWIVLIGKTWQMIQIKKQSREFCYLFSMQKEKPLHFQFSSTSKLNSRSIPNPFFEVYKTAKHNALQLLSRQGSRTNESLSSPDLDLIASQTASTALSQSKALEKHLFYLSTAATLGPFLGLLGTVWGILLTFSQLPQGLSSSNTSMLSGLSMALSTTVIGLLIAIPALAGYNYLKNSCREYKRELDHFTHMLLGSVEITYRKDL